MPESECNERIQIMRPTKTILNSAYIHDAHPVCLPKCSSYESELERVHAFELELLEFRDELLRLAKLPWKPNLNDGVRITAAPLWKSFRLPKWQKTLKETWEELDRGDYD